MRISWSNPRRKPVSRRKSGETFGEFYDAISGEVLDSELIEKAREAEMETFGKREVYEKAPLEDCWRVIGRAPVGVK